MTKNNKRPGQKTTKSVNYHESPPSRELNDSDYEPNAKCEKPLDNKCYPSETRIAIQKIIDENKHANQGVSATHNEAIGHAVIENTLQSPALPEITDVSSLSPVRPVATSSSKAKTLLYQRQQQNRKVKNRTYYQMKHQKKIVWSLLILHHLMLHLEIPKQQMVLMENLTLTMIQTIQTCQTTHLLNQNEESSKPE